LDDLGLASLDQLPELDGSDVQESALERLDFEALSSRLDAADLFTPDAPEGAEASPLSSDSEATDPAATDSTPPGAP
jgi:segregation and condensation protein B